MNPTGMYGNYGVMPKYGNMSIPQNQAASTNMLFEQQLNTLKQQIANLENLLSLQSHPNVPNTPMAQPQNNQNPQSGYAEIVPVNSVDEAFQTPMNVGESKIYMTTDEQYICTRRAHEHGIESVVYGRIDDWQKNKKEVSKPEFNPDDFVRKDSLKQEVLSIMTGRKVKEDR